MARRLRSPRWIFGAVMLVALVLNLNSAANPTKYQSSDEAAYGKLGISIAENGEYGGHRKFADPLHWPPGYPGMLALAHLVSSSKADDAKNDVPAGYYFQALCALLTAVAVFFMVKRLCGGREGPAALAGGLMALYPPAILQTTEQVSEPLGALALIVAMLVLVWAATGGPPWSWGLAGVCLGLTALVRADYVVVVFPMAVIAAASFVWPRASRDWRKAAWAGGVLIAGAIIAMAPWVIHASDRKGKFVPVTEGGGAALYVGTYLPGDGKIIGVKRVLAKQLYAQSPVLRKYKRPENIPGEAVLNYVHRKYPKLTRDEALTHEGKRNIRKYALGQPWGFFKMMVNKVYNTWTKYARGGARHTSPVYRIWHILLMLFCFSGIVAGFVKRRNWLIPLIAFPILYSTALHTLVVARPRYNFPLIPLVIGLGVAGWWTYRQEQASAASEQDAQPESAETSSAAVSTTA